MSARLYLQAIGQRLLVEAEKEGRGRRHDELRSRIGEREAELRRLTVELESLLKVEAEQRDVLEKLSNNESGGV
jgi:intraflagellar transport protein 20